MHGGKSPGAPLGQGNGNWKHGRFTKEWIEERRRLRALLRELRGLVYKDENTTDLTMTMASPTVVPAGALDFTPSPGDVFGDGDR